MTWLVFLVTRLGWTVQILWHVPPSQRTDGTSLLRPAKEANLQQQLRRTQICFYYFLGEGWVISSNRWLEEALLWVCVQQQINTFIWNKQPFAMLGSFLFLYFWGNSFVFQLPEFIPEGDFLFLWFDALIFPATCVCACSCVFVQFALLCSVHSGVFRVDQLVQVHEWWDLTFKCQPVQTATKPIT